MSLTDSAPAIRRGIVRLARCRESFNRLLAVGRYRLCFVCIGKTFRQSECNETFFCKPGLIL